MEPIPPFRTSLMDLLRKITSWLHVMRLFTYPIGVLGVWMMCFWCLEQGVDVVRMTNEQADVAMPVLHDPRVWCNLFMVQAAFVMWFFSRLLAIAYDGAVRRELLMRLHLPRFLGLSCFNVVLIAQLRAGAYGPPIGSGAALALFAIGGPLWYVLGQKIVLITKPWWPQGPWPVRWTLLFAMIALLGAALIAARGGAIVSIVFHLLTQLIFQWWIVSRYDLMQAMQGDWPVFTWVGKRPPFKWFNKFFEPAYREYLANNKEILVKLDRVPIHGTTDQVGGLFTLEFGFFSLFSVLGLFSFVVFIYATWKVAFAVQLGSMAITLLGLTIVLAFLCICDLVHAIKHVHLLAMLVIVAFVLGQFADPHDVHLLPAPIGEARNFNDRMKLKEYLKQWCTEREPALERTKGKYPMIFVLADGGASRSGYWVASVLGRLQDTVRIDSARFDKHLFCLSGASGGGVGNGTFFALLYGDHALHARIRSYHDEGCGILRQDLLSPTLAAMLGPDVANLLLPVVNLTDRARSLERALQHADDTSAISSVFSHPLRWMVTQRDEIGERDRLPILCLNTTRMQDGRPAVISTIDLREDFYNGRIDVLDKVPRDMDMQFATAVIMGARFPYVSPAGHIHSDEPGKGDNYFVDGGYFDNSGAGIVHEMIAQIFFTGKLLQDSVGMDPALLNKIEPYVIHIGNSGMVIPAPGKVSPFVNDLAAPIKTLIGAYGMQTDVNDQRLKTLLERKYGKVRPHYLDLQLYRPGAERESYPMSWAISRQARERMDKRLDTHMELGELIRWLDLACPDSLWPKSHEDPQYRKDLNLTTVPDHTNPEPPDTLKRLPAKR